MDNDAAAPTPPGSQTRFSLILRLKASDREARDRLGRLYAASVYRWVRNSGLSPGEAEDAVQTVFLRAFERVATFQRHRTGSFRSWLKTIAHYAAVDVLNARTRALGGDGVLQEVAAP